MNQRRRPQQGRRGQQQKPKRLDLWRPVAPLPPIEPIIPAADPTALLRSLGDPPLQGQLSAHYLAAVINRSAVVATALAASAGLLAESEDDVS